MNRLHTVYNNMRLVRGLLGTKNPVLIHKELDKMINTVKIFYKSKQDFINNFPDQDDMQGKIRLLVSRRT